MLCLIYRDYPDFYKKLYSLLEPSVFHVKYRARFFHLANLFLSSRCDHSVSTCFFPFRQHGCSVYWCIVCAPLQPPASLPGRCVHQTPGPSGPHSSTHSSSHSPAHHLQPDPPPPVLQSPDPQTQHRRRCVVPYSHSWLCSSTCADVNKKRCFCASWQSLSRIRTSWMKRIPLSVTP